MVGELAQAVAAALLRQLLRHSMDSAVGTNADGKDPARTSPAVNGEMGNNRNEGDKTSEWHRHYAMSGRFEDISCWSKIFGMVFAIRGMVLVSFFADRSVVG